MGGGGDPKSCLHVCHECINNWVHWGTGYWSHSSELQSSWKVTFTFEVVSLLFSLVVFSSRSSSEAGI